MIKAFLYKLFRLGVSSDTPKVLIKEEKQEPVFQHVYNSYIAVEELLVRFTTVIPYIEALYGIIYNLKNKALIHSSLIPRESKKVKIDRFFLTIDNEFLDSVKYKEMLVSTCEEFLTLYERLEEDETIDQVTRSSLRNIRGLKGEVLYLLETINRVDNKIRTWMNQNQKVIPPEDQGRF